MSRVADGFLARASGGLARRVAMRPWCALGGALALLVVAAGLMALARLDVTLLGAWTDPECAARAHVWSRDD